jgi:hypothetical protein
MAALLGEELQRDEVGRGVVGRPHQIDFGRGILGKNGNV